MAFPWDDVQEEIWQSWCAGAAQRFETKRRVAGGARHVDVVVWGRVSRLPFFDFVPAGLTAIENKAAGTRLRPRDVLRFHGHIGLLLDREIEDGKGRVPDLDRTSGLLLGGRFARSLLREPLLAGEELAPGIRCPSGLRPRIYMIAADELELSRRNAPVILYYGSKEAAARVARQVPADAYRPHVTQSLLLQRVWLGELLKGGGSAMDKVEREWSRQALRRSPALRKWLIGLFDPEVLVQELGVDTVRKLLGKMEREGKGGTRGGGQRTRSKARRTS